MKPLHALRTQPELVAAAAAGLAISGIWLGAWTVGDASGPWSLTQSGVGVLGIFTGLLALGSAAAGMWFARSVEEREVFPAQLADAGEPAVLTRAGGQVIATNDAMDRLAGRPVRRLAALLEPVVETDARMIYRLARGALRVGFSFDEVRDRRGGGLVYLVARAVDQDRIAWTVVEPHALSGAMPLSMTGRYESAPFCHVALQGGEVVGANLRFRATFGPDAASVLKPLLGDAGPRQGRVLLRAADGRHRLMRAFVSTQGRIAEAGERLDDDRIDLFLFDLGDRQAMRGGPGIGLERIPVAFLQVNADGRLLWLNESARRMLGPGAAPGILLESLVEESGRPLSSLMDEAMLGSRQSRTEMVRPLGAAPGTFAQISFSRVEIDGEETLLGVLSDASELRLLEDKFAQSQKMEAVGKLAGGVAHDFNNLLTAINGHCDLLLLGRDASQPDYADLSQIKQNANRAAALVRQLLAFSRKQTLNPALISLKDVISDTLYLLDRLIGDRVTLVLDHARDGQDVRVRADRQQIEQALINLVVNARDAMAGGGAVTISTRLRSYAADEQRLGVMIPAGSYVELAVADEGTGIEETVMNKVFDPFFTTKPMGEGTGLGLSTVYGIVKQSGGYVFAENRAEGGACFRILLPRATQAETPAEAPKPVPEAPAGDLTGEASVLLVEDEASVRAVAMRSLKLRGYTVTAVDSARDALAIVEDEAAPIDLVISDVMMPGMDGPTFVARARAIRPGLRVLFISGYAEDAFRRNMSEPGCAFLAKPFSIADLTQKVKDVLAGTVE